MGTLRKLGPRIVDEPVDAITKWRLLKARSELWQLSIKQPPLIRLLDKRLDYLGTLLGQLRRGQEWEKLVDDSGVGKLRVAWSDWLADLVAHRTRVEEDLHVAIDMNPNIRGWETRLGYRVTAITAVKNDDGTREVEIELIQLREHAKHIALIPTPLSAPEFQPIKTWVWFQNLRSNLWFTTNLNLARSFWPMLSFPTSFADPIHWATTRAGNLSPLHWPIQVQYVNPFLDQSRMLPLAAKLQMLHDIHKPLGMDAGVTMIDYLWLPEDETSPHPELAALIGEEAARPTRACIVLAFEDKSGVTGPTGTFIDGAFNLIGATFDDLITTTILPLDADGDGVTDPFMRRILGVAPEKPSLVWRDGEYSGIISSRHRLQRATAQTTWTGGQSPTWLNQLITFVVRYALAQLEQVINYGVGAYQQPGTSGLDNIYQGQADNIFLAYQKFTNPKVALWMNDYAMLDHIEQGNGYAYVIASALTLRQGIFKTSPKISFTMTTRDGRPWFYGFDWLWGDRGMWDIDGIYYVDQIRGGKFSVDEGKAMELSMVIGTGDDVDEFDAGLRSLAGAWNAIGSVIGGAAVAA